MSTPPTPERGEPLCERCGKRSAGVHTCTPYAVQVATLREEIHALKVTLALTEKTVDEERAEVARKDAEIQHMREVLIAVEWHSPRSDADASCPFCGNHQWRGHIEGCAIHHTLTPHPGAPRDGE